MNARFPRYSNIPLRRVPRTIDATTLNTGRTVKCVSPFYGHQYVHRIVNVATTLHKSRRQLVLTQLLALNLLKTVSCPRHASATAQSSYGGAMDKSTADPRALVRLGMQKFAAGRVDDSIEDFDAALALDPSIRPYLWQRGLSLYYVGTEQALQEASLQFREDVSVNPNDTEEAIWAFMCEAKLLGVEAARQNFLSVGQDSRPVMRAAYDVFRQGDSPDEIIRAAKEDKEGHAAFYSMLYVGLWHEAFGNETEAEAAITKATQTRYARQAGDYMASLAKVHALRRGWDSFILE